MIEQNNLQNNNNNNNMILSTNSTKNNPIVNTLIDLGFDPIFSKRIFIYFHPENIGEAIEYLLTENGFIQHNFVQDKNTENDLCYVCGQEKNIHINNNIQLNNNNEEDNKNINNLEVKSDENDEQKMECLSCEELFIETKENKLEKCGHSFCNDCWFYYFSVKIYENKIGLIKCIDQECEEMPDDEFVINLIKSDQNLVARYKKFKYELEIINNQNKKFCPFPNCNSFLEIKDINNKEVKCLNNHIFCFICLEKPHGNSPCKENVLKKSMVEYSKNNLIKRCPKCQTITEKVIGCNHIICTQCNYQWCWLCNGEYNPEHYTRGKCKGYQFFRPQNEEEIKLAFEGKIQLRESQRQEDLEESDSEESEIFVNNQNNSFEIQRRNLFISHNDIPAQKNMSNSDNIIYNIDDDKDEQNDDDDNRMNNDSNNENENVNSNLNNEQDNDDLNIGNNEKNNVNNNNDNLFNYRRDEIENISEDKDKIYNNNIKNSNINISDEINNNEKNNLINSSYYHKNKGNSVNIQNMNKENNNIIEQNANNDLNQPNLSNNNYGIFINNNIIKNNNNNFNNKRYFESPGIKHDIENKNNNEKIKNSITNHENNINNKSDIKIDRVNNDMDLININNNESNPSKVGQINQVFIYNKNNIMDDDKKGNAITLDKLMEKENLGIKKINNNDTLDSNEENSESRFNEKNKKKNKNEIKVYQLSISYKILLTITYILFGHCFIFITIFMEIIKKDFYKLSFLFIIIPYFFIQIYINIILLFPYIFKGFDFFLSEFYFITKFKYNNLKHFLSIRYFSYYSVEILFFGTFLLLIKLISKLLHKKNEFIILSGIFLGLVFLPFHIIINIIMLLFVFCNDEYNPKYMINRLTK